MREEEINKNTYKDILTSVSRSFVFSWNKQRSLTIINLLISTILSVLVYLQLSSFSNIVNEVIRIHANNLGITAILVKQCIFLGLSFLAPTVFNNLQSKFINEIHTRLQTDLQITQVDQFSKLDIATVENSDFQKKLAFANEWGISSISNVVNNIFTVFQNMISLVVAAIILFLINPWLVILVVFGSLPSYFAEKKHGIELFRAYNEQTDDKRILHDRRSFFTIPRKLIETLLLNTAKPFKDEIKKIRDSHDNNIITLSSRRVKIAFLTDLITLVCLLIAVSIVIYSGLKGIIAIGSLVLAFSTYRQFDSTTKHFFHSLTRLQEQARFAKRWYDIFDLKPKIANSSNSITPNWDRPPKIEFRNVSFRYPETSIDVLKNISFVLESGEKLAIVGENGAGKSTLIKLLTRVYDPTDGIILVDNKDLRELDIDHWRSSLGVLLQDYVDYQMTVREAIAVGQPNKPIDEGKIVWAAEMSGAIDFIKKFEKKYDQMIWKGFRDGIELSKGQYQRLAVARIFYRDALISVLDEPTSAIDAVAEEKIFEVLETKMIGKTVVLISHRFSTVKNADQIAVIEHGELKELGAHKDLMAKDGRYAKLYKMQANRYLES
jgi:ATP-binding cassette subfamily B protein